MRCSALSDRGTEYCGTHDRHEHEFCLAVEDIDHTRAKARSSQTNGVVERLHKTMLDQFHRIAFRKKVYAAIQELQADLDARMAEFTHASPHRRKWRFGKAPMRAFLDALPLAREKPDSRRRPSKQTPPESKPANSSRPSGRAETHA